MTYVAHWWSMDGARLAYLTINNSATPVMEIPRFLGGLYPTNMVFPYPKVHALLKASLQSSLNVQVLSDHAPKAF